LSTTDTGTFGYLANVGLWEEGQYVSMADDSGQSTLVYFGILKIQNVSPETTATPFVVLDPILDVQGAPREGVIASSNWLMTYISDTPPTGPV
jgi:hypothetical protein